MERWFSKPVVILGQPVVIVGQNLTKDTVKQHISLEQVSLSCEGNYSDKQVATHIYSTELFPLNTPSCVMSFWLATFTCPVSI